MIEESNSVRCTKCNTPIHEDPLVTPEQRIACPSCGSFSRTIEVAIHDEAAMKSKLGIKAKHKDSKKPFIEQVVGDDLHRNTGKWYKLTRIIDRENNLYTEIITDPTTGTVIHECIEPLTDHTGHGSAKNRDNGDR